MNLRKKTLLMIGATLAALLGVVHLTSSTIVSDGFTKLEKREAERNVQRVLNAFSYYLKKLNDLNFQWSAWDETYTFIENRNENYIQRNLGNTNLLSIRANLMLFINARGELIYGKGFDLKQEKTLPVPQEVPKHLTANKDRLLNPDRRYTGIVILPKGPMAIAAGPILTSEGTGPSRGTLVIGSYLLEEEIQLLAELTDLQIMAYRVNHPQTPDRLKPIVAALSEMSDESPILVKVVSPKVMAGYTLLRDIYGEPALLLKVHIPRDIYQQGQISLTYLMLSLAIVGLVFGIGTLLLLEKIILSRLAHLSDDVQAIGTNSDLSRRVSVTGTDELSNLGNTINSMLGALESYAKELSASRETAERLLLNILPESIADRLKLQQDTIADSFAEVTVLFADIVGFTSLSSRIDAAELVRLLNDIFSRFDRLVERHDLEKIKTIGDCYMVVSGLPVARPDHAEAIAEMALDMQEAIANFNVDFGQSLSMRIGIHTGPVVAGVIGLKKFIYDLWGDTVNTASRMESHGIPGCIHVSSATYECLRDKYLFQNRGAIQVKGKGEMTTYLLTARKVNQLPVISS